MFEVHQFLAARPATPEEVHCLVTALTDKQHTDVRVEKQGRVLLVVAPVGRVVPRNVDLDTLQFRHVRTDLREPFSAEAGDFATVSIGLCYTVKKDLDGKSASGRTKSRTIDPFTPMGGLKAETKDSFFRYLQERTGLHIYNEVNGKLVPVANITIQPAGMPDGAARARKVWFVGQATVTVSQAVVKDPETFNALSGKAIGNRRTYGFGAVWLSGLRAQGQGASDEPSSD